MPADTAEFAIIDGFVFNCETIEASAYVASVGTLYVDAAYPLVSSTVSVCIRDMAGNIAMASDTIIIDMLAPDVSLLIDGGAAYTKQNAVALTLSTNETIAAIAIGDRTMVCDDDTTDYTEYSFSALNEYSV